MALSSLADISAALAAGKEHGLMWAKTFGSGLGGANSRWFDLSGFAGTPGANGWTGTALACQNVNSLSGFGLWHSNVSPDVKHLLSMVTQTAATGIVPGVLTLVDMQCYWPGISLTSALAQNFTGTPSLRYTNGEGCRLYLVVTTANGGSSANLSVSYTDQGGTPGNALPVTVTCNGSLGVGAIAHAGANANNTPAPFLPLAAGDTGVQDVASVTLSGSMGAGVAALVLARPIASIPVSVASAGCTTDYLIMTPGLPVIKDDACLTFLYSCSGSPTSTYITGTAGFVWG